MQMAFAMRAQALHIDVFATLQLEVQLSRTQAQELLQDHAKASALEPAAPLQLSCYLCNVAVVDVQSWKRHMRQRHIQYWAQQEKQVAEQLRKLTFGRPCPFCKTEFQKNSGSACDQMPPSTSDSQLHLLRCACRIRGSKSRRCRAPLPLRQPTQGRKARIPEGADFDANWQPTDRPAPCGSRSENYHRKRKKRTQPRKR